jgi:hypothetical protein
MNFPNILRVIGGLEILIGLVFYFIVARVWIAMFSDLNTNISNLGYFSVGSLLLFGLTQIVAGQLIRRSQSQLQNTQAVIGLVIVLLSVLIPACLTYLFVDGVYNYKTFY